MNLLKRFVARGLPFILKAFLVCHTVALSTFLLIADALMPSSMLCAGGVSNSLKKLGDHSDVFDRIRFGMKQVRTGYASRYLRSGSQKARRIGHALNWSADSDLTEKIMGRLHLRADIRAAKLYGEDILKIPNFRDSDEWADALQFELIRKLKARGYSPASHMGLQSSKSYQTLIRNGVIAFDNRPMLTPTRDLFLHARNIHPLAVYLIDEVGRLNGLERFVDTYRILSSGGAVDNSLYDILIESNYGFSSFHPISPQLGMEYLNRGPRAGVPASVPGFIE